MIENDFFVLLNIMCQSLQVG